MTVHFAHFSTASAFCATIAGAMALVTARVLAAAHDLASGLTL
jgi:hypothetical protein